jgi:hypothetical protein
LEEGEHGRRVAGLWIDDAFFGGSESRSFNPESSGFSLLSVGGVDPIDFHLMVGLAP